MFQKIISLMLLIILKLTEFDSKTQCYNIPFAFVFICLNDFFFYIVFVFITVNWSLPFISCSEKFFSNRNFYLLKEKINKFAYQLSFQTEFSYKSISNLFSYSLTLAYRINFIRSFLPPSLTGHSQSISKPSITSLL